MNFWKSLEKEVLSILKSELPESCYYHSVGHTKDVLAQCLVIAKEEGLTENEVNILKLAALFHDIGFTISPKNHEEQGCKISEKRLRELNLENNIIDQVKSAIMATKIPQSPKNKLEQVLCDADLDYLGREDFYEIGNKLFKELKVQQIVSNELEWNQLQVKFLSNHSYYTEYSKLNRSKEKLKHLEQIKILVNTELK
jgi:predicted metal-dependent HD superfamily phosphohydrolase